MEEGKLYCLTNLETLLISMFWILRTSTVYSLSTTHVMCGVLTSLSVVATTHLTDQILLLSIGF